jgi:alkanesulfonate monooxygenase SsuD/methylene tetrahydromethanopterin reductase-like flavin-dependent oxidoreductase (luciferase family)
VEYLLDHIWIVGDPDEVTRKLRALRGDIGEFGTLLVIGHEWEPRERWVRSMTLLQERVLPHL